MVILAVISIYLLFRNNKVCDFRLRIIDLSFRYNIHTIEALGTSRDDDAYTWLYGTLPEYNKMLFSIKPLELETYFSTEQIKKLKDIDIIKNQDNAV